MERVENTRQEILNIITSRKLTHEQKLTNLAGQADSLLEVLDLPDGLEELLEPVEESSVSVICLRSCTSKTEIHCPGLCKVYERRKQVLTA